MKRKSVPCEKRFDWKRLLVELRRVDTGELVETRRMTLEERQLELPGVDDARADRH